MDLKKREQRSSTALCRETCGFQPLNSAVIRMLGFPTSCERLLERRRAKFGGRFKSMKIKQLKQEKILHLDGCIGTNRKLTSLPEEIGDLNAQTAEGVATRRQHADFIA
jgi:hypothetical protein